MHGHQTRYTLHNFFFLSEINTRKITDGGYKNILFLCNVALGNIFGQKQSLAFTYVGITDRNFLQFSVTLCIYLTVTFFACQMRHLKSRGILLMCQLYILFNSTGGVESFLKEHFYFYQQEVIFFLFMTKLEEVKISI